MKQYVMRDVEKNGFICLIDKETFGYIERYDFHYSSDVDMALRFNWTKAYKLKKKMQGMAGYYPIEIVEIEQTKWKTNERIRDER